MLYIKNKKEYTLVSSKEQLTQGMIVKYTSKRPTSSGTLYFVKTVHDDFIELHNTVSVRDVKYCLETNKFLF